MANHVIIARCVNLELYDLVNYNNFENNIIYNKLNKMSIKFNIDKRLNSFEAPNFLKWFIIPFVIILILGYIVGSVYVYRDIKKGGYDYKKYDEECERKNKIECSHLTNKNEYNHCLRFKNDARCNYTIEKTGKSGPIFAYLLVPLVIALILSSLLYKILLYIKNPKVAGGVFVFNALFK